MTRTLAAALILCATPAFSGEDTVLRSARDICAENMHHTGHLLSCDPIGRLCNTAYNKDWVAACVVIDVLWTSSGAEARAKERADEQAILAAKQRRRDLDFVEGVAAGRIK